MATVVMVIHARPRSRFRFLKMFASSLVIILAILFLMPGK
jgi:hypothetical protein